MKAKKVLSLMIALIFTVCLLGACNGGGSEEDQSIRYTISFVTNGGGSVNSQTISEGNALYEPTAPTKSGFVFDGWSTDSSADNIVTFPLHPTSDMTLYAIWSLAEMYTVTFESNGGSSVASQQIQKGKLVTQPTAPTLEDNEFAGWYSDEQLLYSWNFSSSTVSQNITLYAKWQLKYTEDSYFTFTKIANGYSIGLLDSANYPQNIRIPRNYQGESVTEIVDSAFANCSSLKKLEIHASVTSIGENALQGCTSLEELIVPFIGNGSNINHIGYIFGNQSSNDTLPVTLKKITVTNAQTIGEAAFKYAAFVEQVTLPEYLQTIESDAFANCTALKQIDIPKTTSSIGLGAFANCPNLASISLPFVGNGNGQGHFGYIFGAADYSKNAQFVPLALKSVKILGGGQVVANAFENCPIEEVELTGNIYSVGEQVFKNCLSLKRVVIGKNVNSIGAKIFENCTTIEDLIIPFAGTNDGTHGFGYLYANEYGSGDKTYSVPNAAKYALTSLEITNSTVIYEKTFAGWSSPFQITLPEGLREIRDQAFYYARLSSIIFPDTLISIGDNAFYGNMLTEIVLPDSLTTLGSNAFGDNSSLRKIHIGASLTDIKSDSEDFYTCFHYILPESITVSENNTSYKSVNGNLYNKDGTTLLKYSSFKKEASFKVPDGVTRIGNYAFYTNYESVAQSLTSVELPNGLAEIGKYAFAGRTMLADINFPNSLRVIEDNAFALLPITSFEMPDSLQTIGEYAFFECTKLTRVVLKEGIKSIGACAFDKCVLLADITVPDTTIEIGDAAFGRNPATFGYSTAWYINQPDGEVYLGKIFYVYKGNLANYSTLSIREGTIGIAGGFLHDIVMSQKVGIKLMFPASVEYMNIWFTWGANAIASITVNATTPPRLSKEATLASENIPYNIYVPRESLELYKTAEGWKDIAHKIYPIT